ncbi:MAG: hypothetical protein Q8880_01580 [Bacteroidota bacterium]|nr:hypothetical protein [Bacteroidota bacterium]
MENEVGIWIDHKSAILVFLGAKEERIMRINSNISSPLLTGGSKDVKPTDELDRRFKDHIGKYFYEVISNIRKCESILIMGPGEAKLELKKRLENEKLQNHIIGVENADKMTEPQLITTVIQYFAK